MGHPEIEKIRRQSDCFFFHGINILLLQSNATIFYAQHWMQKVDDKISCSLEVFSFWANTTIVNTERFECQWVKEICFKASCVMMYRDASLYLQRLPVTTLLLSRHAMYRSVLSKWEFFIKTRAVYLLSPYFITRARMGASKAALILMKNSHFDRTLQYEASIIGSIYPK